ncbi:MAG: TIM barrel protein [Brucellaceae bacterium]|nr:TIM barrel protein [Brucellaceae bacterium]
MPSKPTFALNHMAAPRLDCRAFIDLAASLGCAGVELRNDLADKRLTERAFFDGEPPEVIGAHARGCGLRLLGLSEAYGFNDWSDAMRAKVQMLIDQATASGAESISLIPSNDGAAMADTERLGKLRAALGEILPMLEKASMTALIEPLGFTTSSLRLKSEAIEAIDAVGGGARYKLVHDTFHHHLAGETQFFPDRTGIVHISGVTDPALDVGDMQDGHRILVDAHDRLGNVAQIRELLDAGYEGAFSYEPFSPSVHALDDPEAALRASMDFISAALVGQAA